MYYCEKVSLRGGSLELTQTLIHDIKSQPLKRLDKLISDIYCCIYCRASLWIEIGCALEDWL